MRPFVFVYGTLKKGFRANYMLDKCELVSTEAVTTGRLYTLGWFPGLLLPKDDDQSTVIGDLYSFPKEEKEMTDVIAQLDRYEGAPNLYRRQLRYAYVDGVAKPAFMYIYNGVPDEISRIPGGVWIGEKDNGQEEVGSRRVAGT